ncbi:MAG: DNRLRE domain-containing protein, partial [Actinomycetota bacterium]|nr:DNRLRE domain-containing protein [Actinomycetota bacterium]
MVKQASSGSAFGATTPLLSDAQDLSTSGSAINAYLRFNVPALAEGEYVTAASMRLRTVPSYGGTSNGPLVWRTENASSVTSAESMTWSSGRPARRGTAAVGNFGSLGHDVHVSTAVSGVGPGLVSFELAPESNDAIVFRSREDSTDAYRPELVLTVSAEPPPPPPAETSRTVVVRAEADTMVKQASSGSAFGATTPLLSDAQDLSTSGSAINAYLRFNVPALAE